MTDSETITRLGNQFGADYVMAGSITSLEKSKLLIVSIVKIDVIQQVAGAFLVYNTLDELNNNKAVIEKMAGELMSLMKKDTGKTDKLAVLPVEFAGGANKEEGDVLAQLLSIYLIQNGKYAVYPRTKTLEQVQSEYKTQLSGITRESEAAAIGRGVNPQYVLSIVSRMIGSSNRFNASVINLEGGDQTAGETEQYSTLSDGINAMGFLAKKLSGVQITEQERNRRVSSMDAAERERQREEAALKRKKARQKAADSFLENSGIKLAGWGGGMEGVSKMEKDKIYSGGGEIELCLSRYFGLQTGITIFEEEGKPFSGSSKVKLKKVTQIPFLARLDLKAVTYGDGDYADDMYYALLSIYSGIGKNFSSASDVTLLSSPPLSFIAGVEIGAGGKHFGLFGGYQYQHDFSATKYSYYSYYGGQQSFSYNGSRHIWRVGMSWYIPFRRN
jgi:hypothetical protein